MSHFDAMYSLDDCGQQGLFYDSMGGSMTHSAPVSFEFDNFGVTPKVQVDSSLQHVQTSENISSQPNSSLPSLDTPDTSIHHAISVETTESHMPPSADIPGIDREPSNPDCDTAVYPGQLPEEGPTIDIAINNVVCSFATRCHLNLRRIAMEGMNVIHKKENGMVSMKLRKPYTTASIWSSGKITCTGATSEDASKKAARRFARKLQRLGFKTKVANFRVVNVLGTCSLPFGINIAAFSQKYPREASYEPELHPGVTYKLKEPKATLKIFSTGSITVTAPRVTNVQSAIEHIFPLVYEHRKEIEELENMDFAQAQAYMRPENRRKRQQMEKQKALVYKRQRFDDSDEEDWTDTDEELCSDDSGH